MSELSPEEMDELDESIDRSTEASAGVDPDHIEADFRNGVLEVRLPKPAQLKPKRIELAGGRKALNK